jgi:glycosyltransferase involved in cell wall biosynthesis
MLMKVSVIIPTFNRASLVVETLESALDQTFLDREIIVVDDGSTDDTKQRLAPYLDEITYIYQENQGVNAARNHAMSVAQGEYIALLDSDDLWQPFLLELFVTILDSTDNVGFVYSDFALLKPDGTIRHSVLKNWYTRESNFDKLFDSSRSLPSRLGDSLPVPGLQDARLYLGNIYHTSLFHPAVLPSASLFRRSLTAARQPFNEDDSTCGDWEFFANLSKEYGAAFVNIETAFNRSHDDEVRLMRIDLAVRLRRQIAFVERVWKADADFMNRASSDVHAQLQSLYFTLIKFELVSGNGAAARASVKDYKRSRVPGRSTKLSLLLLVAQLPGSAALLRWLRIARDKFLGQNL